MYPVLQVSESDCGSATTKDERPAHDIDFSIDRQK